MDLEEKLAKLTDMLEAQTAAAAEEKRRTQREREQHARELQERDARIAELLARSSAVSEVSAREYDPSVQPPSYTAASARRAGGRTRGPQVRAGRHLRLRSRAVSGSGGVCVASRPAHHLPDGLRP